MRTVLFSVAIIFSNYVVGQEDALEEAKKLIEDRKYESAIQFLNKADPQNEDPAIVIAKTDLYLEYFVTSIMHQLFALKDLSPDEELMDIRGTSGDFAMFQFSPDSVILQLLETNPENYMLNKTLGNYYQDVHLKYGGNWLAPDSIIIRNFYHHYKIAWDHGVSDHWSAYGLGYACLTIDNLEDAIIYLKKSTELKNDYPSSHYNLAYAYLNTNQPEKCVESSKHALALYDEPIPKSDAARIAALAYQQMEDYDSALNYYLQADKIDPHNYYTLKPLLETEMALGKSSIQMHTKEFFILAPGNPTIYQDLMKIYWAVNKPDDLIKFLNAQFDEFKNDDKVVGNLFFYIAVIQYDQENFVMSKENFTKSKATFEKVFKPDHGVFGAIDSYLNEM